MFDPELSYPYCRVGDHSGLTVNRKHVEHLTIYQFSTGQHPYLVEVEKYPYEIYVFKFYKRIHKKNKQRYNLLTNEGKCSRIVGTCFSIFLAIFESNPLASFGFLGAHTIDRRRNIEEPKHETRRFVVYRQAVQNYFGMETFTHFEDIDTSIYLAISNQKRARDSRKSQRDGKPAFRQVNPLRGIRNAYLLARIRPFPQICGDDRTQRI